MAAETLTEGVFVEAAGHTVRLVPPAGTPRRRGAAAAPDDAPRAGLRAALREADFEIAAEIEIAPPPPGQRRIAGMRPVVSVAVGENESAVMLLESAGGVFVWRAADAREPAPNQRRGSGGRQTLLSFRIGPASTAPPPALARRGPVLDWLGERLVDPVRSFVLRFVVTKTIDAAVARIEGDNPSGPVVVGGAQPAEWVPKPLSTVLRQDRPARLLLMIHGTFSSTAGSFGHLVGHQEGLAFIAAAVAGYDLVLGHDHRTLADDPRANAEALLATLTSLRLPSGSVIDAVAYSRGGLVYRVLAEQLIGPAGLDVALGKAVFVGCTNGGTNLAEPENWADLVDVYTNVTMAVARLAALAVGAPLPPGVALAIRTLGRFVQMFSEIAITERKLPGLAAMEPDGVLVRALNAVPADAARLGRSFAVTCNFEPTLDLGEGLPREVAEFLGNRIADRLFAEPNDLVVHTRAMTAFGEGAVLQPDHLHAFGTTGRIYHTVYFNSPDVARELTRWLDPARSGDVPAVLGTQAGGHEPTAIPAAPDAAIHGLASAASRALEHSLARLPPALRGPAGRNIRAWTFVSQDHDFGSGSERVASVPASARGGRTEGGGGGGGGGRHGSGVPPAGAEDDGASRSTETAAADAPSIRSVPPAPVIAEPALTPAAPAQVERYIAAEMDPYPKLGSPANVFVTVSPDRITVGAHAAAAATDRPAALEAGRKLDVEVIPRSNCRVVGDGVRSLDSAAPTEIITRLSVEGIAAGDAELIVEARQGRQIVASFILKPIFVDANRPPLAASLPLSAPDAHCDVPVLRIYEFREANNAITLRFDLGSDEPAIALLETVTLPAGLDLGAYVGRVLGDVEKAWDLRSEDRLYESFVQRLADDAVVRANAMLPEKVRAALWAGRESIKAIQIISEEPLIPWELMCVTDPTGASPERRGFLAEWGVVRWLHGARRPGRRLGFRGDHSFAVIPDYLAPDLALGGVEQERAMLSEVLPRIADVVPTSLDVCTFFREGAADADVLHFACHGMAEQAAVLNSDLLMRGFRARNGSVRDDPLTAEQVKANLRLAADRPRSLVFLNSCQTGRTGEGIAGVAGFADAFLRPISGRGAAAFVGALWSIDTNLAESFAAAFYRGLASGATLVEAAGAARRACQNGQDFTWLAFTVYGHPLARAEREGVIL